MDKKRNIALDIIRGVAALLIVLFHYTSHYNASAQTPLEVEWGVWFGYAAVTTFFMLSGFLSTGAIFSGKTTRKGYIKGRLRRFYPAYWICMTITVAVLGLFYAEEALTVGEWAVNLTMVSRLFGVQYADGAYWSMQYELIFCLYVLILMGLKDRRTVLRVLVWWMAAALALNCIPSEGMPKVVRRVVKILDYAVMSRYCHCFAAGIALRVLADETRQGVRAIWKSPAGRTALWVLGLGTLNGLVAEGAGSPNFVFFVITAVLLFFSDRLNGLVSGESRPVRAICWIAAISYPLYLLHEMVGFAMFHQFTRAGHTSGWIILPVTAGVVFLAAAVTAVDRLIQGRLRGKKG